MGCPLAPQIFPSLYLEEGNFWKMWLPKVALWLAIATSPLAKTFVNPVTYEDFSDNDVW